MSKSPRTARLNALEFNQIPKAMAMHYYCKSQNNENPLIDLGLHEPLVNINLNLKSVPHGGT